MKILILGYGGVGRLLTQMLLKEKQVEEIFCGDINIEKEEKKKKLSVKKVDISDKKNILKLIKIFKPDVVVNAALPTFNLLILECALKQKVNYIDSASYWDFNPKRSSKQSPYKVEQLDYDKLFKKAKIIGLINSGVSPGLTNLFAAECAEKLDEVDYIKIRLLEDSGADELCCPWSREWLLDEINWKPLVYRNGNYKLVEHFSEPEEFNFPKPVGKKTVALLSQEEVETIPLFLKIKNVDIKAYDNQVEIVQEMIKKNKRANEKITNKEIRESLAKLLMACPTKVNFQDKKFNNARFALSVVGEGKCNGKNKTAECAAIFPKQKEINAMWHGANFIIYPTVLMLKTFLMQMPKLKEFGVYPPEKIDKENRQEIIKKIKRNKIFLKFK